MSKTCKDVVEDKITEVQTTMELLERVRKDIIATGVHPDDVSVVHLGDGKYGLIVV